MKAPRSHVVAPRLVRAGAFVAALAVAAGATAARAEPTIAVRVSIKVIRNPANGARPPVDFAGTIPIPDTTLTAAVERANAMLGPYFRGYRYSIVEIRDIGQTCAVCDTTNPSYWYDDVVGDYLERFENVAKQYPVAYGWVTSAINVYVNQGMGNGGVSSFPDPAGSDDVVVFGSTCFAPTYAAYWGAATFHHEIGHYFDLPHTLADACKDCPVSCSLVATDGDGLFDTILDNPCMTRDRLSVYRYGVPYASLPTQAMRDTVDDTHVNNMTYIHADQTFGQTILDRRTEQQLDRWTDVANVQRAAVRNGRTWFVDTHGSLGGTGSSASPFLTVAQGRASANVLGGDILILRPGAYAPPTLDRPLTLRATRKGSAFLGP